MMVELKYRARDPRDFPGWSFETLNVRYDEASRSAWMVHAAEAPPHYTLQTLQDMADCRESLRALVASGPEAPPIDYFVVASDQPGVFMLGGDLEMFSDAIEAGDADLLTRYAHACIDVVYGLLTPLADSVVSLSVIEGQALGGGLEAALAEDFLLSEETARLGVPEVAFNTFPGMGAVTLLSRRLGFAQAEDIMLTGKVYSGDEMRDLGVADVVAPQGEGRLAALDWMRKGGPDRHARRLAMAQARRRLFPVTSDELIRITDLWVQTSLQVTPHDLRHMRRLAAAQRRLASGT